MKHATVLQVLAPAALFAISFVNERSANASELSPHVSIDLGFNTRSDGGLNLTTWAPNLSAYAVVDPDLALSLDWGLTAVNGREAIGTGVEPLNPFLAAYATPAHGPLRLRLGLGVALPIAEARTENELNAYRSARALRGGWDPWLYRPDTFSLVVPVRAELAVGPPLLLAAEGAVFVLFGTAAGSGEQLGFQGALEATGRLGILDLGARLQAVSETPDEAQVSVEPFARVHLGPVGLLARLTLNLDEPDGFAFDRGGIWGAHVGLAFYY